MWLHLDWWLELKLIVTTTAHKSQGSDFAIPEACSRGRDKQITAELLDVACEPCWWNVWPPYVCSSSLLLQDLFRDAGEHQPLQKVRKFHDRKIAQQTVSTRGTSSHDQLEQMGQDEGSLCRPTPLSFSGNLNGDGGDGDQRWKWHWRRWQHHSTAAVSGERPDHPNVWAGLHGPKSGGRARQGFEKEYGWNVGPRH